MNEKAVIEEAVRCHLSLLRGFGDEKLGQILILDQMGFFDGGSPASSAPPNLLAIADRLRKHYLGELELAPTWPIDDDVLDTLEDIWPEYPSTTAYSSDLSNVPPTGFSYLSRPIPDPKFGKSTMLYGIFWSVSSGGPADNMADVGDDEMLLTMMFLTHAVKAGFRPDEVPVLYPYTSVVWKLDAPDGGMLWMDEELRRIALSQRSEFVKFFLSLVSIMRDRIAVPEDPKESLSKVTKKRFKFHRETHPKINTEVKVVRFRPHTGSGDRTREAAPSGRKLTVRFWRRKFWRWQWYPSTEENKPRLIIPKRPVGPEGAPLINAARVFMLPKPLGPKPVKEWQ